MKCFNCDKEIIGQPIKSEPNRQACSPGSINKDLEKKYQYFNYFCSKECRQETDKARYKFWAELDRNTSDSECFIHDHWEKADFGRKIRVGKCSITGKKVKVEPLQPGDNSGQPIECYKHFKLRSSYL